ncbi:MAG: hypothetical protein JWM26_3430 [Betaproteobacteria bacterium]|nr:hypothetical protein [Betaproteobacteria bacterium]
MAERYVGDPLAEDRARRPEGEPTRDPARPGGPADVVAGRHGDHWEVPRDYGALAHAAGAAGAHDARNDAPGRSPDDPDPFAPRRYRYDMTPPPLELHDGEQLVGGHGYSGLSRRMEPQLQRRGPKGYRRTDERIREDLCESLMAATHLDASEVTVDVREGNVTLEGIVPERRMKHAIEDIAAAVRGVFDVVNRIRVVRGGAEPLLSRPRDDER